MNTFFSLLLGVFSSLMATLIFVWFSRRIKNRNRVLILSYQLRNLLNRVENMLLPDSSFPRADNVMVISSMQIQEWRLDRHQWFNWHTQVDEIQAKLSALFHSLLDHDSMWRFFKICPQTLIPGGTKTVEDHFRSIDSAILRYRPNTEYLGLLEFATETINLLRRAESKYRACVKRSKEIKNFIDVKPDDKSLFYNQEKDIISYKDAAGKIGSSMLGIRIYEDELEEVRKQIKSHREYLEKILPKSYGVS